MGTEAPETKKKLGKTYTFFPHCGATALNKALQLSHDVKLISSAFPDA